MKSYRHGSNWLAVAAVAIAVLSLPGCWQQRAAQQRAMAAAVKAEEDALRAEHEARRTRDVAIANQDIANGILKLKEYPPLPSPAWQGKYIALLKERCNVGYEVVQGPPQISDSLRDEVNAYNEVMRTEIERRFGAGILDKLSVEAQEK